MATGIINNALQPTGAVTNPQLDVTQDATKTTAQLAPTNWNVTDDQTTSGQFNKITAQDSPLMQMARASAQAQSNSRGLLNSTMAGTAGEAAAYQAALPMAQSNAATYADAAKTNATTSNAFSQQQNAQANALQTGAVNQGYTQQNLATQQGFDLAKMDKAAVIALNQLSAQQKADLAKMAVAQGYNLDTLSAQQINDLAKLATQQSYTQSNLGLQQTFDLAKMQQAQQNNLQTLQTQYGFDIAKMDAATQNTLKTMTVEQQNTLAKLATQQGYNLQSMGFQQINDLAKLSRQIEGQTSIANIEAQYRQMIQGSASATSLLNTAQNSIDQIVANQALKNDLPDPTKPEGADLGNGKLNYGAKTLAIQAVQDNLSQGMALIGSLAGDADLQSYIGSLMGGVTSGAPTVGSAGSNTTSVGGTAGTSTAGPIGNKPPAVTVSDVSAKAAQMSAQNKLSPEQNAYNYLKSLGYTAAQMDSLYGFAPGSVANAFEKQAASSAPVPSISVDTVTQQARQMSSVNGKSAEQNAYDYLKSLGYSASQMDALYGFAPGSVASVFGA